MAMQLSDANQKVLLLAFQATPQSGWLKPDWGKFMVLGGYKTRQSAQSMFCYATRHLREAIKAAESSQANGAAGTEADLGSSRPSTKKTGRASGVSKRAPKGSGIQAESDFELFEFSDLEKSIQPKQTGARLVEHKVPSKKRKSTTDDANHSIRGAGEQTADRMSSFMGAQIPAAQIPGAQLALINNPKSSSLPTREKGIYDELESYVNSEPVPKKQKTIKARNDTPFGSPGSVANNRPASNHTLIDHPSPSRPSPISKQKIEDMLKYNDYLAETEEQRSMREQAAIDFWGMSDDEIEPLGKNADNDQTSVPAADRSVARLREDAYTL